MIEKVSPKLKNRKVIKKPRNQEKQENPQKHKKFLVDYPFCLINLSPFGVL
jgi:hypothetical protein